MQRWRWVGSCAAVLTAVASVVLAPGALAATSIGYRGTTRQTDTRTHHHHAPLTISFRISNNQITGVQFTINDRCPDGHVLMIHSYGYPAMGIVGSKFAGSFSVVGGKPGEGSTVSGTVSASGATVTGSLTDAGWSRREKALCHGKTTFTAHRHT